MKLSDYLVILTAALALLGAIAKVREGRIAKQQEARATAESTQRQNEIMLAAGRYRDAVDTIARSQLAAAPVRVAASAGFESAEERLRSLSAGASRETAEEIKKRAILQELEAGASSRAQELNGGYRDIFLLAMRAIRSSIEMYPKTTFAPKITEIEMPARIMGTSYEQFGRRTMPETYLLMEIEFTPNMSWKIVLNAGRVQSPRDLFLKDGFQPPDAGGVEVVDPELGIFETQMKFKTVNVERTLASVRIVDGKPKLLVFSSSDISENTIRDIDAKLTSGEQIANLTLELIDRCRIRAIEVR